MSIADKDIEGKRYLRYGGRKICRREKEKKIQKRNKGKRDTEEGRKTKEIQRREEKQKRYREGKKEIESTEDGRKRNEIPRREERKMRYRGGKKEK